MSALSIVKEANKGIKIKINVRKSKTRISLVDFILLKTTSTEKNIVKINITPKFEGKNFKNQYRL
jgi:hypothetical protein